MSGDLHPYDGVERRYRHTDADTAAGLAAVGKLLRWAGPLAGLEYDVSFYSGGVGVLDKLAISFAVGTEGWGPFVRALEAVPVGELAGDEDCLWLVRGDEETVAPEVAVVGFVNEQRKAFQPVCLATDRVFFQRWSNVNDWLVLWGDDSRLSYLAYSAG